MLLSPFDVFLAAVPTIVLSLWYVYRSARINRYDTIAIVMSFVYGMALEAMSIKEVAEYGYADLWFMFGSAPNWVPYSVGLGWASMIYVGMQTSDRVGLPWWQRPFLDGAIATVMDLVLDPGASATRWVLPDSGPCMLQTTPTFGGIGAWTWCVPEGTQGFWYTVPLGNFIGWFVIVATLSFCYRAGREWFGADRRGWLAQAGLVIAAAGLSMGACVLLLQQTGIATRSGAVQWTVFAVLLGTPVLLVAAQRARLHFDRPVAWGIVVWPLYIYAVWVAMFIARRVDPAWWPLAPVGIVAAAGVGLLLLFLPNLALLRRRSR